MKSRNYSLVAYGNLKTIEKVIVSHKTIKNYAFILHDKEDCEPHIHILIHMAAALQDTVVTNWFKIDTEENCFAENLIDKQGAYEYLTHDNTDKVSYSKDSIYTNDPTYWETPDNKAVEIINDMLVGVDLYSMMSKYGRDLILNYEKYKNFADILKNGLTNKNNCDNIDSPERE